MKKKRYKEEDCIFTFWFREMPGCSHPFEEIITTNTIQEGVLYLFQNGYVTEDTKINLFETIKDYMTQHKKLGRVPEAALLLSLMNGDCRILKIEQKDRETNVIVKTYS